MSYHLVAPDNEVFNSKLEEFDFSDPAMDPIELRQVLFDEMNSANGLGLSANQLGLPYRVFIMRGNPSVVCFNPKITYYSEDHSVLPEGCLTYPGLYVKIRRPSMIRVRYTDEFGNLQTSKFSGITARCFQHEMDHMDGINFLHRAKKYHLDQARRKQKLFLRKLKRL